MGCTSSKSKIPVSKTTTPKKKVPATTTKVKKRMMIVAKIPSIPNYFKQGATFSDKYTVTEKLLGKGGEGIVVEGHFNNKTQMKIAVKIIDRAVSDTTGSNEKWYDVKKEVTILSKLQHPNIMKIYDFFESENIFIIVTELIPGGTLLERLKKRKHYTEDDTHAVIMALVNVVAYLHSLHIVHRDLKPENLLLTYYGNQVQFKLCDFGIATICEDNSLTEPFGSPPYVAPEIVTRLPYGKAVDVWAIGCIMFFLLSGELPFHAEAKQDIYNKIATVDYKFLPLQIWDNISEDAKDFLFKIFIANVHNRITLQGIMDHPWMNNQNNLLSHDADTVGDGVEGDEEVSVSSYSVGLSASSSFNTHHHKRRGSKRFSLFEGNRSLSMIRIEFQSRDSLDSIYGSNYTEMEIPPK